MQLYKTQELYAIVVDTAYEISGLFGSVAIAMTELSNTL